MSASRSEPPLLPPFQAELPDGLSRGFHVGGSEKLLEACGRAAPAVRPLLASVPKPSAGPTSSATTTEDGSLVVRLTSPTGRRSEVRAIRAGGADLRMSPAAVTVAGKDPAVVRLIAPTSCAKQWQISGIPSALDVDLVSGPGTSSAVRTTVPVRLGPVLTDWLLATSCPEPR